MQTEGCTYGRSRRTHERISRLIREAGIKATTAYTDQGGLLIDWNGDVVRYESEADAEAAIREAAG